MTQDKSLGMEAAELLALLGWPDDKRGRRRMYSWTAKQRITKLPGTQLYWRSQVMAALNGGFPEVTKAAPKLSAYEKQKRKNDGLKTPLHDGAKKKGRR